jgi:phage protein U
MFAVLGEMIFEVLTAPEQFRASSSYSYAEHKVVEAPPRIQWLANELQTISFELGLHVAFTNPASQMNRLHAAAQDHRARALVFGNGVHRGYFVIERIEETHHQLADDGSFIAISAHVELKEWIPGAGFDPLAPPKLASPPPGVLSAPPGAAPSTYNPSQPIGPHNLMPTSAIVQLTAAGAGPGVSYAPAPYAQPGVAGLVNNPPPDPAANYLDVPLSAIVRADSSPSLILPPPPPAMAPTARGSSSGVVNVPPATR